ncbi:phosphatase PAP2 family protein [Aureliella helgolandensis]|uniref:phosphatase PAP2 family protein n=1 Tax=Aureliella helgolandensis TaxID=2527968 RepID=UPI0018D0EFBC|nr:phosphatase PAP2 family protein [Aureliella helgolandensis]
MTNPKVSQLSARLLSLRFGLLLAAGLCMATAWLITGLDTEWSAHLRQIHVPGDLRRAIDLSEAFAHGLGAAAILGSILLVSVDRRPAVWVAVMITISSGLMANGLKSCFVRVRPHSQELVRLVEGAPVEATAAGEVALQLDFWDARQRSFPSGHTATAWGLMIGLSLAFPRGTALFAVLAMLASLQRLTSGAHFPSDVLAGGAIACLCAVLILSIPRCLSAVGQSGGSEANSLY